MTAIFALAPESTNAAPGRMRPLNVLRDLPAVADLIELCFSNTLDPEGRNYIDQMRRNGRDTNFLNWAPRVIESVSLPLSGFVWEDGGRIVGNVSLIPFSKAGQKVFLIANVATHPAYRRQGIARLLTEAAMQRARTRSADAIWLHVRQDNPGAIALYQQLGFSERTRRTSWYTSSGNATLASEHNGQVVIRSRTNRDWVQQNRWLEVNYPSGLDWYFSHKWNVLRPGLFNALYCLLAEIETVQWSAFNGEKLGAVLACQRSLGRSDHLWLATSRKPDPDLVTQLLLHGRRALSERYSLSLEFPAGIVDDAIRAAGFLPQRTLVWMEAPGAQPS